MDGFTILSSGRPAPGRPSPGQLQTTLAAEEKESQLFWIVALRARGELVAASGRR